MNSSAERYDVVIAGGGTAGLTLACALADALGPDARIAVVDRVQLRPGAGADDARAFALSAGAKRMLATLGVWPAIAAHTQAVTAVDITDSSLQDAFRPVLVSYDNTVDGGEPATYIVEHGQLRDALLAAAAARPCITLLGGEPAAGFEVDEHGVNVDLARGPSPHTLRAALLVAADGRASPLRQAAGIGVVRWSYPQAGIVTTVRLEQPHQGRAVQHFLPSGPFAILPLTGNRACITWTEDDARAREILALDDAGFLAEVEQRFGYRLGGVALAGPRASWPLDMHLARALVADRFALIGDAAHGVHPIAGQGLNLGLRDVAALTEVVADAARLGLDVGSLAVLERYERWRRLELGAVRRHLRRSQPALLQRFNAAALGPRLRPRPSRAPARSQAAVRCRSRGPYRRCAPAAAGRAGLTSSVCRCCLGAGPIAILYAHEIEPAGRSDRAAGGAVAGLQRGGEIAGAPLAIADQLERAHHRAHLVVQERARPRLDADLLAADGHVEAVERLDRRLGLAAGGTERREVVPADQRAGGLRASPPRRAAAAPTTRGRDRAPAGPAAPGCDRGSGARWR